MKGVVVCFEMDFGTIWLSKEADEQFHDLLLLSCGDGRKKAVRDARQDIKRYELGMQAISEMAFRFQIDAGDLIFKKIK